MPQTISKPMIGSEIVMIIMTVLFHWTIRIGADFPYMPFVSNMITMITLILVMGICAVAAVRSTMYMYRKLVEVDPPANALPYPTQFGQSAPVTLRNYNHGAMTTDEHRAKTKADNGDAVIANIIATVLKEKHFTIAKIREIILSYEDIFESFDTEIQLQDDVIQFVHFLEKHGLSTYITAKIRDLTVQTDTMVCQHIMMKSEYCVAVYNDLYNIIERCVFALPKTQIAEREHTVVLNAIGSYIETRLGRKPHLTTFLTKAECIKMRFKKNYDDVMFAPDQLPKANIVYNAAITNVRFIADYVHFLDELYAPACITELEKFLIASAEWKPINLIDILRDRGEWNNQKGIAMEKIQNASDHILFSNGFYKWFLTLIRQIKTVAENYRITTFVPLAAAINRCLFNLKNRYEVYDASLSAYIDQYKVEECSCVFG